MKQATNRRVLRPTYTFYVWNEKKRPQRRMKVVYCWTGQRCHLIHCGLHSGWWWDEWWIGEDSEGSVLGLIVLPIWHSPEGLRKTTKNISQDIGVSQPRFNPRTSWRYGATTTRAGTAQSVWWLATGWAVTGSNPDGGEIFRIRPDRPWSPPSLLHNGYRVSRA